MLNTYLIVCPLVFLAGFVDSIAGGGGLISLPAYLIAGLPMHSAIATNKVSSTMGSVTACARYLKSGFIDIPLVIPCIAVALGGSAIGASLTELVNEAAL
ncbi:MAG: TSUP family transporter, partial [Spirochaetaceae bacterium]|nr:TSUP family transporter [Spirochaetaceae bacterium]